MVLVAAVGAACVRNGKTTVANRARAASTFVAASGEDDAGGFGSVEVAARWVAKPALLSPSGAEVGAGALC